MADRYANFKELAAASEPDIDYRIRYADRGSSVAIIAPHGGTIEPETAEIAEAIAGTEHSRSMSSNHCNPERMAISTLPLTASMNRSPLTWSAGLTPQLRSMGARTTEVKPYGWVAARPGCAMPSPCRCATPGSRQDRTRRCRAFMSSISATGRAPAKVCNWNFHDRSAADWGRNRQSAKISAGPSVT